MFVGHYGPAFALKRAVPETSLFALGIAVQLVDVAWGVFVLTGIEQVRIVPGFTESNSLDLHYMPFTHGLLATLLWAIAGGLGAWLLAGRKTPRVGVAVALAVASHWLLDVLMHRPDLPLYADEMKVGLGLWNHRWPAFAAEIVALVGGLAIYVSGTKPRDAIGRFGPAVLAVALTGVQLFNLLADPAKTPRDAAIGGLVSFLAIPVVLAFVDRHRERAD
jgi:hypothetical protein